MWTQAGLNCRPSAYEAAATYTTELWVRVIIILLIDFARRRNVNSCIYHY